MARVKTVEGGLKPEVKVAAVEKLKPVDKSDRFSWRAKGIHALATLSLLLAACGADQNATAPLPGVTEAMPNTPSQVVPMPVEVPPTVVAAAATSTEAVFAGGGRPPLCDPLLAPFIPGEEASQNSAGEWIDSQGNELTGADVNGTLFVMSRLAEEGEFKLVVQAASLGEEFRWWVKPVAKNGRPGWVGSSQDPFLDRPDSLPEDAELKIDLLPDPGIAGEIVFGVSGGEVTAAVLQRGTAVRCFDPVANEWFVPDSGAAAEETVPPPPDNTLEPAAATSTPALSTPKSDGDPQEPLLTELAEDKASPEPTTAPTAEVRQSPKPTPLPPPTPTPEQPMSEELQRLVAVGWPTITTIDNGYARVEVKEPLPLRNPNAIIIADCRNLTPKGDCLPVPEYKYTDFESVTQAWEVAKKYANGSPVAIRYSGDTSRPDLGYVISSVIVIYP